MPIDIHHRFESPFPDKENASDSVRPSDWNDGHIVELTGRLLALDNSAEIWATLLALASAEDILAALEAAPLMSPNLDGTPTAPLPPTASNSNQIATTAWVKARIDALISAAPGALDTLQELAGALGDDPNFATTITNALAAKAPLDSPALTGNPTAPTQAPGDSSTRLATTAFVNVGLAGKSNVGHGHAQSDVTGLVDALASKADAGHGHDQSDITGLVAALAAKAPLASPALTGVPTAPTQAAGNNSTRIATTAFVAAAIANLIGGAPGALDTLQELADALGDDPNFAATVLDALAGKAAIGHGHEQADITGLVSALAAKAPLASPVLTGNPTAPTQTAGNNSTRIATTAFVTDGLAGKSNIGHGHAQSDVTGLVSALASKSEVGHGHEQSEIVGLTSALAAKAPLASPALTGTPTAPTQAVGNNSTRLATTAFVATAIANLIGGAPGALDTLQELADALGDDPNFAATVLDALAGKAAIGHGHDQADIAGLVSALAAKAPLASPALTGNPTAPTQTAGNNSTRLATTAFVQAAVGTSASRVGEVFWHASSYPPSYGLALDGAVLSRATFANLWSHAQMSGNLAASEVAKEAGQFGPGDGSTTFTLPDLVSGGEFVRSVSSGRSVGTAQLDQMQQITGSIDGVFAGAGSGATGAFEIDEYSGNKQAGGGSVASFYLDSTNSPGARVGTETRPRNIALLPCIVF